MCVCVCLSVGPSIRPVCLCTCVKGNTVNYILYGVIPFITTTTPNVTSFISSSEYNRISGYQLNFKDLLNNMRKEKRLIVI